jgi:hypothetical protein
VGFDFAARPGSDFAARPPMRGPSVFDFFFGAFGIEIFAAAESTAQPNRPGASERSSPGGYVDWRVNYRRPPAAAFALGFELFFFG